MPGPEPDRPELVLVYAHVAAAAAGPHQEALLPRAQQLRPNELCAQVYMD